MALMYNNTLLLHLIIYYFVPVWERLGVNLIKDISNMISQLSLFKNDMTGSFPYTWLEATIMEINTMHNQCYPSVFASKPIFLNIFIKIYLDSLSTFK